MASPVRASRRLTARSSSSSRAAAYSSWKPGCRRHSLSVRGQTPTAPAASSIVPWESKAATATSHRSSGLLLFPAIHCPALPETAPRD
jgi:hypothetical protein